MLEERAHDLDLPAPPPVRFESMDDFIREFRDNISAGALFVPTPEPYAPKQLVDVTLDLAFCDQKVSLPAEIVAVVDPALAEAGETMPGISVRFRASLSELREQLTSVTGLVLEVPDTTKANEKKRSARSEAHADIVIVSPDAEYSGETANISYTGVLALLQMAKIPVGVDVRVHLANPTVELYLNVDGRVIHSRRCDGGVIAHGIQLQYPADRIEEVMAFVEFLQSFDRARRLAIVTGDIDSSGLGAVLDMFVNTAPSGTLVVARGEDRGKIVFSENFILRCTVGMVSGMKALARMFLWTDGRFEFHHDLQLPETPDDPQEFDTAMMMASVEMDEMARIGFDAFAPSDTFDPRPDQAQQHRDSLTDLERQILDYAVDGFNVEAIADMIPDGDADIYKALVVLIEVGALAQRS